MRACFRYKRGYKNIINKGVELNKDGVDCELMMETSGHGALRENRFLDDGAYMSVKLIIEAARRRWEGRPGIRYPPSLHEPPCTCIAFHTGIGSDRGNPQSTIKYRTCIAIFAVFKNAIRGAPGGGGVSGAHSLTHCSPQSLNCFKERLRK